MTPKLLLAATLLALTSSNRPAVSVADTASAIVRSTIGTTPPAAWRADDPADSLYRQAREALNRGSYREAARMFASIVDRYPQSVYAGDALYWQAFAEYSIGERRSLQAALAALDAQKSRYPSAATRGDADALAIRVQGALAKLGDSDAAQSVAATASAAGKPCTAGGNDERDDEDSDRAAALNALLQMNADQAMPILKQVLAKRDACSVSLRKKALFMVSQHRSSETEDILLDVVRNDPSRDVRKMAIFWLGQVNSDRASAALEQILNGSGGGDEELREQAAFALMQQSSGRGQAAVRAAALDDRSPDALRQQAVFWIGQHRSPENAAFLRDLFSRLASASGARNEELQNKILFSLSQMRGEGNDRWLMEVAADPKYSVEIRKQAIFGAGQIKVPTAELTELYGKVTDREIRAQLIWVLGDRRDPAAVDRLIDIAKHDKDPEMRKRAIFWLGQSHDPRVKQLLLDLITGESPQ